jgi:hypothetical protein
MGPHLALIAADANQVFRGCGTIGRMTRDQLLADIRRALAAAEPERVESLLRALERDLPADGEAFVPHPETIPAAERLAVIRKAVESAFPDRAATIFEELLRKEATARVISAALPRQGSAFERTEGKGSSHVRLTADACVQCGGSGTTHYLGSDVLEGGLEINHLVHTEVADWFSCTECAATWSEGRYI